MQKKLCEISSPKQWKTISSDMLIADGYPVYGANGIIGYFTEYNHECETLLITCRGATCGALNICQPYSYVNGNAMALDNLSDDVDIKYLYYYLLNRGLSDVITGSAQPQIVRQSLDKVIVEYPSLSKQKEIASNLNRIEELISFRTSQLSKLDELVKSRFIELFGDLKANPYNWECKNLLDVADIDTVMVNDYEKYADYPHIGIDSIEKNTGRLVGYRTIAEDGVISGKYLFTDKHIIYSKIRPNLNKVALPNFEGLCSADAYPILPKENVCLRVYLGYVMRSEFFLDYILPFSRRANMPKVNKEQLSGFVLPVPDIATQNQFATFVEQTDKLKFEVKEALEKLETLKKSLMQQYFE